MDITARPRILIIGGGSYKWTPRLGTDFILEPALEGATLALYDIDPVANEECATYCRLAAQRAGRDMKVETHTELSTAARDADFVIMTIAVGGLDAVEHDLAIPARYGIVHPVGDTVGPSGLVRTLRHMPVAAEIARTVAEVAPNAWFFNYTNPMSAITRAIARTSTLRVIGCCHGLFETVYDLADLLNVERGAVVPVAGGINHFVWLLKLNAYGEDLFPWVRDYWNAHREELWRFDENDVMARPEVDRMLVKFTMLEVFGYLPAPQDRHVSEFLPGILAPGARHGLAYGVGKTTVESRRHSAAANRRRVQRRIARPERIPLRSSGEKAAEMIAHVWNGTEGFFPVNLPNHGQISNLPKGAVVETMGVVGPNGPTGLCVGELPPGVAALLNRHIANQEMAVEAGLTGDRSLALQAFVNDPMVPDVVTARKLLDELIAAHASFLPQF